MSMYTPVRASRLRPNVVGAAALAGLALAVAATPAVRVEPALDEAIRPAASEPLPASFRQIGPFCNVVIGPDNSRSSDNCFLSGYVCPLAWAMPIGYGMMKVRLVNDGTDAAVVRSWWHVIVRCEPMDVGPYVTWLAPGETKVVAHFEPAFSFNDKVRFYRWTAQGGHVFAAYAGGGCAPADDRGMPERFVPHPRSECDMGFARSATWSPGIFLPLALSEAALR